MITKEFKVMTLRDHVVEDRSGNAPDKIYKYWEDVLKNHPYVHPDKESFIVIFLSTRAKIIGHELVSVGTLDTLLVHPREVFRCAIAHGRVYSVVVLHNHPSGDTTPSEADINITRDLIRAGELLKMPVNDHLIVSHNYNPNVTHTRQYTSLRELGYFLN